MEEVDEEGEAITNRRASYCHYGGTGSPGKLSQRREWRRGEGRKGGGRKEKGKERKRGRRKERKEGK